MNITIGELAILLGVPSAVTGLLVWWLKRWLEKKEKKTEERGQALIDILKAQIMCNNASLSLAEATANAVSRIPDAHCNGDMHEALEVAKKMREEQGALLVQLGVGSVKV